MKSKKSKEKSPKKVFNARSARALTQKGEKRGRRTAERRRFPLTPGEGGTNSASQREGVLQIKGRGPGEDLQFEGGGRSSAIC